MLEFEERILRIKDAGLYRSLRDSNARGSLIEIDGENFLNFASNDYLGISARSDFQLEFLKTIETGNLHLFGSTSSRLLGGNSSAFSTLENFLSEIYTAAARAEDALASEKACLLYNGGYHANTGVIPALAQKGDLIVCDKLSHASLIDALKLADADFVRYPHSDLEMLSEILRRRRASYKNVFIVTESVFSMDGDLSNLRKISDIAREFEAFLYVDEAHSVGVFGRGGLGLCAEQGVLSRVDFLMCTLGKAAGSQGAFLICSPEVRSLLINTSRTLIFTTAMPPVSALWSKFAFEKILQMDSQRNNLKENSKIFRQILGENLPLQILGESQIVPLVLCENEKATLLSEALFENKIYAPAVRHPSVPKNSARIRFSLNADFNAGEIREAALLVSAKWKDLA